jgi:hypothetical protein
LPITPYVITPKRCRIAVATQAVNHLAARASEVGRKQTIRSATANGQSGPSLANL